MRNFKDIIIEKLKISKNNIELPDLEDFEMAVYNFNAAHEIHFEEIDAKYKDLKNCPKYENNGTLYYVFSIFTAMYTGGSKFLHVFCYRDEFVPDKNFMIMSMNQLVEVLGEELVLKIWDYIR